MHVEVENYLSPHGLVLCLTSYSQFGEGWSRGDESSLDCFGEGLVGVSRISLQVQHFVITLVDLLVTIVGTFFHHGFPWACTPFLSCLCISRFDMCLPPQSSLSLQPSTDMSLCDMLVPVMAKLSISVLHLPWHLGNLLITHIYLR